MAVYKCIAACCFISDLNLMLNHGDTITSEQLHDVDAKDYVRRGFLEEVSDGSNKISKEELEAENQRSMAKEAAATESSESTDTTASPEGKKTTSRTKK